MVAIDKLVVVPSGFGTDMTFGNKLKVNTITSVVTACRTNELTFMQNNPQLLKESCLDVISIMDTPQRPSVQNHPPLTPTQKSLQLTLNREVASLKNLLETVEIPAAKKAEFRTRLGELQERIRRAQKLAAGSNLQTALNGGVEFADAAVAHGQGYSVLRIDVGLDTNALKEAVTLVMEKHKDLAVMIFSVDEEKNKVLVHAGVPDSAAKRGLQVLEWLRVALAPIHGKGGGAKNGLAQGQGSNAAGIDEALAVAKAFASKIFAK